MQISFVPKSWCHYDLLFFWYALIIILSIVFNNSLSGFPRSFICLYDCDLKTWSSHKKNPKYTGFGWIIYAIGHRTIFYEKVRKRNTIKFFQDFRGNKNFRIFWKFFECNWNWLILDTWKWEIELILPRLKINFSEKRIIE